MLVPNDFICQNDSRKLWVYNERTVQVLFWKAKSMFQFILVPIYTLAMKKNRGMLQSGSKTKNAAFVRPLQFDIIFP